MISGSLVDPSGDVCVSNFASRKEKMVAPFRGTFKGTIADLKDIDYSSNGNMVRYFKLVDVVGNYIECCAARHNANSVALKNNYEVILYFASGRPQMGTSPSTLFVMKEGVIMPLGLKMLPPLPQNHIEIRTRGGSAQ